MAKLLGDGPCKWVYGYFLFLFLTSGCVEIHAQYDIGHVHAVLREAHAEAAGDTLTVSTGRVSRTWKWTGYGFATTGLHDNDRAWDAPVVAASACDWSLPGAIDGKTPAVLESLTADEDNDDGFASPHLEVTARVRYDVAHIEVEYVVWAFPGANGLRTQLRIKALSGFDPQQKGLRIADREYKSYGGTLSAAGARTDLLPLDFSRRNERRYWGYYNDPGNRLSASTPMLKEDLVTGFPVFQNEVVEWASGEAVSFGSAGVIEVKESPKTVNQSAYLTGSFFSGPLGLQVTGWGLAPSEFSEQRFRDCWATWTILYDGSQDGLQFALKSFDARRYPVVPKRDMFLMSNTWGPGDPNGSRFADEQFVLREIPAAKHLGLDVVQIDDGWQRGGSSSGATDFLPKYPDGWQSIHKAAETSGIRLGLWAAAQHAEVDEMEKDLDDLHFITWKMDFDHLASRSDYEARNQTYRTLMKYAPLRTQFALCPEYDDPRYGWYYAREYGSIFFQNIQEGVPAHLTFVPFQALRQVWLMSKFFPANKLQVMLQNPKRTRRDLSDAYEYPPTYTFAMGLPFVPVFFQSSQFLDDASREQLRVLIAEFKKVEQDVFTSITFPIGTEPNNASWTGFQLVSSERPGGYVLLFRELHNADAHHAVALKFLSGKTITIREIPLRGSSAPAAEQKVIVGSNGDVDFAISNPADFRLYQYSLVQ